jgi:NADH:ubiquinone oxidoreductase subunit
MFDFILRLLGPHSPAYTASVNFFSWKKFIGEDGYGNKYYSAAPRKGYKHDRRWVIYKGEAEPSRVPPEWHGWLHHQTDLVPSQSKTSYRRSWQKPHKPNLTGTTGAYRPQGHLLQGGKRASASADYEAWDPTAKPAAKKKK